jgi:hypothetical protein
MDALNSLRAVLVACAFVAAVLLGSRGQWFPAGVLFLGIGAHLALFVWLRKQKARETEQGLHI